MNAVLEKRGCACMCPENNEMVAETHETCAVAIEEPISHAAATTDCMSTASVSNAFHQSIWASVSFWTPMTVHIQHTPKTYGEFVTVKIGLRRTASPVVPWSEETGLP